MYKFKHQDYKSFKNSKIVLDSDYACIYYLDSKDFGFMISVSRKIGNAVCRNKIKRRIRHIFRESKIDSGLLMIKTKKPIVTLSFSELKEILMNNILKDAYNTEL